MKDTDRILVGTDWIKVSAKHHGQKGKIDNVGPRGPRMRLVGNPIESRHGSSHGGSQPQYQRLDWFELGNTWEPLDSGSRSRYDLWQTAREIERLDIEVQKESDNPIMTEEETVEMVACNSVYHHPKKGEVPKTHAYLTRNNNYICTTCKAKRESYQRNHAAKMREAKAAKITAIQTVAPPRLIIEPDIITDEVKPQWRVTLVVRTVTVVQALDFLDLAAQLEGKGEIVKVEKI